MTLKILPTRIAACVCVNESSKPSFTTSTTLETLPTKISAPVFVCVCLNESSKPSFFLRHQVSRPRPHGHWVAAANTDGGADAGEGDRGALHVAQAIRTVTLQDICAHCGKQGAELKRCSICKCVWYCGATCQNAAWKRHKKTCAPPLSMGDIRAKVLAGYAASEWRDVLELEGRMEEMMKGQSDATCEMITMAFRRAHLQESISTGYPHDLSIISLGKQRVEILGKMQRFRDQGVEICVIAKHLKHVGKRQDAAEYYRKARKVADAHGFFVVECKACQGLGELAVEDGHTEEGLDLLRNALATLPLAEHSGDEWEIPVLSTLIRALFKTHAVDEVEPLVMRFREAATAESARGGRLHVEELNSFLFSARLHEVRAYPFRFVNPSTLLGTYSHQGQ